MKSNPTAEERLWSVIAHLSALAMGIGLFIPILGWSLNRRKSNYTSFQNLQALGYQSLGYTIWLLTLLLVSTFLFFLLIILGPTIDTTSNDLTYWVFGFSGLIFVLLGLYFLFPIIAAIACALGKDFHYPLMGKKLARYLGYDFTHPDTNRKWLIEDHEDRWVASMGHFSIIIIFWGMVAPLAVWVLQGKRSLWLKVQSVQTLLFQALTNILYLGAGFTYFFGIFAFLISYGLIAGQESDSQASLISALIILVILLITLFIVLIVPLLQILGQWAGYRVLKGHDYHYPLLGKMTEKRIMMKTNSIHEETVR